MSNLLVSKHVTASKCGKWAQRVITLNLFNCNTSEIDFLRLFHISYHWTKTLTFISPRIRSRKKLLGCHHGVMAARISHRLLIPWQDFFQAWFRSKIRSCCPLWPVTTFRCPHPHPLSLENCAFQRKKFLLVVQKFFNKFLGGMFNIFCQLTLLIFSTFTAGCKARALLSILFFHCWNGTF